MYCKHCGKEIESETDFCPYCGKAQKDAVRTGSPQIDGFFNTKAGQNFKIASMPILGVIMLVSAVAGLMVAPKSIWLIIACVLFIVLGVGCLIQFYSLIKGNNDKRSR